MVEVPNHRSHQIHSIQAASFGGREWLKHQTIGDKLQIPIIYARNEVLQTHMFLLLKLFKLNCFPLPSTRFSNLGHHACEDHPVHTGALKKKNCTSGWETFVSWWVWSYLKIPRSPIHATYHELLKNNMFDDILALGASHGLSWLAPAPGWFSEGSNQVWILWVVNLLVS